jgi:hypothetical protein
MKLKSEFAILDIPGRRRSEKVADRLKIGPIHVMIEAEIVGEWSRYDGTSQEFEMRVISAKEVATS